MTDSQAFKQLDPQIQHYLWAEQWEALHAVQEQAIPLIAPGNQDVLIAASTASGKTEAAFLPALTHMLQQPEPTLIIYISPLKALINDQFGRLQHLCKNLEIPVWPWHGDITASSKRKFLATRHGVLLITPESLEATLCRRGTSIGALLGRTSYFIIDEIHAFIGSERGKQLQSQLHRIETVLGHVVPRIGLSATLGDISLAATFLRNGRPPALVDIHSRNELLQVLVKGFEEPPALSTHSPTDESNQANGSTDPAKVAVAQYLFKALHGSNNLVFPNSRQEVETYTHLLNLLCAQSHIPHQFWPHHGNLSKELRAETERALQQHDHPATAVCTSTLELGIDLGAVKSVAQIGTPPSVANLRQRLGRSGRRKGETAILRSCIIESALNGQNPLGDQLRLRTVQTAAAISLLLENWFEPPEVAGLHYSTLVQQLLAAIAQCGGLKAAHAFQLLCAPESPFDGISKSNFAELLRILGEKEILTQDHSDLLLHGRIGDRIVNHHSFYAAFASEEEFRVVSKGKTLGTLPVPHLLIPHQCILFGGKTWCIETVDEAHKTIHVTPTHGGNPPLFHGNSGRVHTRVRQRMRELYLGQSPLAFLDSTAQRFVAEGREAFHTLQLRDRRLLDQGDKVLLLTWLGDSANEAIACLLLARGIHAPSNGLGVEIDRSGKSLQEIESILIEIATTPAPPIDNLLAKAPNLEKQKWDHLLSQHLLHATYASSNLHLDEALAWLKAKFPAS